jgi:hypothetical protein
MIDVILIEIRAVPAERSRGRHNPRVVKRKMSNFPTKSRSAPRATPSQSFRYEEHIFIVAPPEPAPPEPTAPTTAGRTRAASKTDPAQSAQSDRQTFWSGQVQAWKASGLPRTVYCQHHGLSPQAFNAWVARLRHTLRRIPKAAFVPP